MRATIIIATAVAAAALWRAAAGVPAAAPVRSPASATTLASAANYAGRGGRSPLAEAGAASIAARTVAPAEAAAASGIARIEAAVREARRRGKGEQEAYRLRSESMPAAQVEALARMEAAESNWRRRVEALQAACAANIGCDDARASFTREELAKTAAYAAPALRQ